MKDLMGLFAVRKGDREIMLNKRKGDGRPALHMLQLVDSEEEEESVKLGAASKKRLMRRNFFKKRSKPVFNKFDDEIIGGSPSNAYQPPPLHLFPGVAQNNEKEKTIAIAGTHSTDSSSTTRLQDYQPPTFRIAALEPSMSVEEVQRACSPSVESDRRSSSSFVQFAFDPDFQRIEELAMFGEPPMPKEATKDVSTKKRKALSKKAKTSLEFPTLSFENMAMQQSADFPKKTTVSPSQSVVSVSNATITGFDDGVPLSYTEETTTNADPFVAMSNDMDAFGQPFKIDAVASEELLGTQWVEANASFAEPKTTSSHDSSSLIESIIRPKKSSSWDLECRKPKTVGMRDPSPRFGSNNSNHRSDQQWGQEDFKIDEFPEDEFPEGGANHTQVFREPICDFDAHLGRTEFPEVVPPVLDTVDFLFDKHRFSEIGFPSSSNDDVQPVNEIVINEQTNCIKGLPASAIAASMIFRQTIAVNEESPCHDDEGHDDFEDHGSFHNAGYFPDGTPMEVLANRRDDDALSSISSLTGSAFAHKRMDVWGRQAQNVINHWNFAAQKVREEMSSPSPSKKSHHEASSAKKSVSDEFMNLFSP